MACHGRIRLVLAFCSILLRLGMTHHRLKQMRPTAHVQRLNERMSGNENGSTFLVALHEFFAIPTGSANNGAPLQVRC
jgi:hypothetical protein